MDMFLIAHYVMIVFLGVVIIVLLRMGDSMDEVLVAIANLRASVSVAIAKIESLKAEHTDPAALKSAAAAIQEVSDQLNGITA